MANTPETPDYSTLNAMLAALKDMQSNKPPPTADELIDLSKKAAEDAFNAITRTGQLVSGRYIGTRLKLLCVASAVTTVKVLLLVALTSGISAEKLLEEHINIVRSLLPDLAKAALEENTALSTEEKKTRWGEVIQPMKRKKTPIRSFLANFFLGVAFGLILIKLITWLGG